MAPDPQPGSRPVPGPANREEFDEAQRRHRRASWRWTLACAAALAAIGIPLSAALSPLILAAAILLADLLNLVVHTPDLLGPFRDALHGERVADVPRLVATVVVALLVPGAIVLTVSWIFVRRFFRREGTPAELLAMGARAPRSVDLEERQLTNVVAEIAIAGGLPQPSVHVVDSAVANAAVTGGSPADAAVIVSRGLLDGLHRDETQGVIAHLVGRVGNGDLGIARTMACLFSTLGLWSALLTAPTQRGARRALRLLVRSGSGHRNPERARELSLALLDAQRLIDDEPIEQRGCLSVLLLPVAAAQLAFAFNQMILTQLVVNPLLKRAWRARSRLADATAVELTRYPEGLAAGLVALTRGGGVIPGTEAVAHLFVVGAEATGQTYPMPDFAIKSFRARKRKYDAELAAAAKTPKYPLTGFQPKMGGRISALRALGATVEFEVTGRRMPLGGKVMLVLFGGPLIVGAYLLGFAVSIALTAVAFMIDAMFLLTPVVIVDTLLRRAG